MAAASESMTINEDHVPGDAEERVIRAFKHERDTFGENRMTPALIRARLDTINNDMSKQNVNYALRQLTAAGWVKKLADGLYEFVDDPRDR